jgi:hypothetical protein
MQCPEECVFKLNTVYGIETGKNIERFEGQLSPAARAKLTRETRGRGRSEYLEMLLDIFRETFHLPYIEGLKIFEDEFLQVIVGVLCYKQSSRISLKKGESVLNPTSSAVIQGELDRAQKASGKIIDWAKFFGTFKPQLFDLWFRD